MGNRLSSLQGSYTYSSSNKIASASNASYTYDNNGNVLSKTDATGTTSYTWDGENRLIQVTLPGTGGSASFKYDPFGRRIHKSSLNGAGIYAYDGANIVEEVDTSGAVIAMYTQSPGVDEPMAMLRGANTSYYQQDGLGAVTSLSDVSGSLAQTYVFDSFGQQTASSGSLTNPFRYTGREFDTETGLYYYRARYYSPETGRFLGEDPIRLHAGVNFYAYVGNNPAIYVDPTGTQGIIDTIVNWISPPPADPALVKLPPPTSPPILSTDMAGHAAQGGSTTFYPGGDASPYSINTRTTVDSKWLRDHPGAGDAYCGSTAYVFYRGYDTPEYGPNGAQINTGDPRLRWIHGGRDKGSGSTLSPTNGCTRGHDQDVIDLGQLITEYQQNHPGMPITYCRR